MVNKVVSSYPTHRKCNSSFYESNHRNDNLPFFSMLEHNTVGQLPAECDI